MQDTEKQSNFRVMIIWLAGVAGLVFIMVVLGGVTRLTGSGLSMTEWRPILGILPPLSSAEWERVFALYRASPEFAAINSTMDLQGFKVIFAFEYAHRLMGRLIGIAYAIPFAVFAAKRAIPRGYGLRLVILLLLGGLQGLVGWWMVQSGLVHDPFVAPYRLAIHLGMALAILAGLLWTVLDLLYGKAHLGDWHCRLVSILLAATIIAGAFVAGLDGGLVYNEFPYMGGTIIPFEYDAAKAFTEPATAQFHHRVLAVITVIGIASLYFPAVRNGYIARFAALITMTGVQFLIGIATLLAAVPVSLGALHQAGACLVLMAFIWLAHGIKK